MNEIAKFDIQLLHEGTLYKIGLKEADKKDRVKFQVAGRTVTPFEYEPLPTSLKEVFNSFNTILMNLIFIELSINPNFQIVFCLKLPIR